MRDWPLTRRLAASLAAVGLIVLAVVTLATASFVATRDLQSRVINSYYEAVTVANQQFLALVDADSAIRRYALTGDPEVLGPARQIGEDPGGDAGLPERLADDPRTRQAHQRASESARTWWRGWAEETIAQVEQDGPDAVGTADLVRGQVLFNRLRGDYDDYVDSLAEGRERAVEDLGDRMAGLFAAVLAVAVVGLVAVVLLAWLLHRWVTRPLTELAARTRTVRDGTLEHPVVVDGPPEIARLGRDVDGMRAALVRQIAAARAAGAELTAAKEALEVRSAELERSNRELEQFAYVASHDLQEPLRKVASFTQMLQRRYGGQLDERADQYIEFAVDGAKRMQQLINDLLQFSRVGRVTAPQTDVDLDACLDRALRDLDTRIEETGASVTRDPLPVVHGEAPLLTQVLVNLVGNALKFRSEDPPRVHVGARRDGDVWRLTVSDNGIGIEPQYAERVFVLFQRLHSKEAYAGTGIGLALARKIVEYHGGTVRLADVHDGPGTTVEITLPAVPEPAEPAPSSPPVPAGASPLPGAPDEA